MTERLFALQPTRFERRARARADRAAQGGLFELEEPAAVECPACGGSSDGCSCGRTGAEALALEV